MQDHPKPYSIVVTGDVTMDWNLAYLSSSTQEHANWNPSDRTTVTWQRGGAALLADLLSLVADQIGQEVGRPFQVFQTGAASSAVNPADPAFHHSFSIWSPLPGKENEGWWVRQFLGLDHASIQDPGALSWMKVVDDPDCADLVLIDDAGLGFRDQPELWPRCLQTAEEPPWVLLKMSHPVGSGPLFKHLLAHFANRLILVTTVNDLRLTEVQISKGLSWERTAQDLLWEMVHNPRINAIAAAAGVVVSFGAAGAVFATRLSSPDRLGQLIFDPAVIEGEWTARQPGSMIGYTTCLAAGIAGQFLRKPQIEEIVPGICAGLTGLRDLHSHGYENTATLPEIQIQFPLAHIADRLLCAASPFAVVEIQDPVSFLSADPQAGVHPPEGGYWCILQDRYRGNLEEVCEQIVLQGAEHVLKDIPQGIFGGLFTVDRQEIESFRSIAALVREYLDQRNPRRPLSIGVFGAPGSGKSFGVTQVARSLAPGMIEVLEFNLSQFESREALTSALHQVRDINLRGKIPLVFWDEFDSAFEGKPLGWLRHFLAPMQDGAFQEGQLVHPIGSAIFVFAGGTSARMDEFGRGLTDAETRAAKVPDFISRLKGFVNVLGPNPPAASEASDPFYMIRRAILLRSILFRNEPQLLRDQDGGRFLNIDQGVLRAFLNVRFYKHGIRSMESVVAMSQLAGKQRFERSSLPPETQLELHVDGQEFLALVQQLDLTDELLEKLAAQFHENFCASLRNQGYQFGPVTDDQALMHSSLRQYQDLPADEQEQNRDTVRHIYTKLAVSGFMMIPARSNELPFAFPGEFLEELSIMEHQRWMDLKLGDGWKHASQLDKAKKFHPDLVPWDQLSESAKEKDRAFVRAIPHILAEAGFTVVKLRPVGKDVND